MQLKLIKNINIYFVLLFILTFFSINRNSFSEYINIFFYDFLHLTLIYVSLYYYNKIFYLFFFAFGFILDLFLSNGFGPHMLSFCSILFLINFYKKYLNNSNSLILFIIINILTFTLFLIEQFFSYILYYEFFSLELYFNLLVVHLIVVIPIIFFFNFIDQID